MIRLKLTIPFFSKGKEQEQPFIGETANLLSLSTTKILSKLNMGDVIGETLCNTFWTAQGSLWLTLGIIL